MKPPSSVMRLFEQAGWAPGRSVGVDAAALADLPHNQHAFVVLSSFGGLRVGISGAGRDCAASDIEFFTAPSKWDVELVEKWRGLTGPLTPIASAQNEHMEVFLDQQGRCYVHTNPDGKLYFVAETFSEAAELLLLGHAWGRVVDAKQ
jgi:hypothetical protein